MRTLTEPVRRRRIVAAGETITVTVLLWREDFIPEVPADLEQALLEAEREATLAQEARDRWEADRVSLQGYVKRLEAAFASLQQTLLRGPLWLAAAAAFALQRVRGELRSARESLPWFESQEAAARQAALGARQALDELRARADSCARVRRLRGRTYTVRLRRVNGDLVPVAADRPDAIPAAIQAARAWLEARTRRADPDPDLARWALDRELQRAAEAQQALDPTSLEEDDFDSFSEDWLWEEELRRRAAADRLLLRSCSPAELREPVLVLLQRDNALQGRAWELAAAWLRDQVAELVSNGVRRYRVPATARGRQAAELIKELGGTPVVFAVPRGDDDSLTAAYLAAMRDVGGLIIVAGSAAAGGSPLYLLDPAIGAATEAAPLVGLRWDRESHRLVETTEPALGRRVPWIRFDVAAAAAATS